MVIVLPLLSFIGMSVGVVFFPRLFPLLYVLAYRLINMGVSPLSTVILYATAAVATSAGIWYLDGIVRLWLAQHKQPSLSDQGISHKICQRFDHTMSLITNRYLIIFSIIVASGTMIPDIFLVEFAKIKLPFYQFILAIGCGKLFSGLVLIYGITTLLSFL